jgi:hypothetical protein
MTSRFSPAMAEASITRLAMPEIQAFVVGMNGSGTTMLADSLGKHPAIYMFPFESKVIPLYLAREREQALANDGSACRRVADEIGRSLPFWRTNGRQPLCVSDDALSGVTDMGSLFQAIFSHLALRTGKPGWVEKSPGNVEHLPALAAAFPRARFIHIIRDGRDAAQSFHRRWWFDPRHTIWRWKHCLRIGRRAGSELGPGRYLEVRYEDLTSDPGHGMQRVCEFVGLPFDEAVLASSMRHMNAKLGDGAATMVCNSERWAECFDLETMADLERLAGRTLDELGFAVTLPGDDELSVAKRRYLRGKDTVMRSLAFFRDRGLQGVPMYLRLLQNAVRTRSIRRY